MTYSYELVEFLYLYVDCRSDPNAVLYFQHGHNSMTSQILGFIYGVPPLPNDRVTLDVVATNKANYETGILKLIINVTSSMTSSIDHINSVRLKIDNLNLVSFFF